ncbi:hypothetical protein [Flavobacterium sp. N3904]|uniref:hypothetical protein n=1 Tax=Flavobacterium sp. N3904 TaxID=2986835 RepID=UPI00222597E8|nr:hypothetical protein [Flavobacterium sp. N3904]
MKHILTFLTLGILLFSCSNNEEESENNQDNDPLITKMSQGFQLGLPTESYTYFEYDNSKRLIKRTGEFVEVPPKGLRFFSDIYTSLVYDNNRVTIENFTDSNLFTIPKNTIYITLNNSMQIEKKEITYITNNHYCKTLFYKYSNNKLVEIKTTLPDNAYGATGPNEFLSFIEKFYYDSNGNLARTESFQQEYGINKGEKIVRIFGDYDNSINPWKRLYLIDDDFYRSISKNNFRKYTEIYYLNDMLISTNEASWVFLYDSNGNILID